MAKVKQLTVALENRPGALAHMAKVLGDAKVNVLEILRVPLTLPNCCGLN